MKNRAFIGYDIVKAYIRFRRYPEQYVIIGEDNIDPILSKPRSVSSQAVTLVRFVHWKDCMRANPIFQVVPVIIDFSSLSQESPDDNNLRNICALLQSKNAIQYALHEVSILQLILPMILLRHVCIGLIAYI